MRIRGLLTPYADVLRRPEMGRLVVSAVFAGMPVGMQALAVLLLAHEATGSYAAASVVVAGAAIGTAAVAPLRGRAVDRRGAAGVLPRFAVVYAIAVGSLVGAAELDAPLPVLVLLAVACGGSAPPVGPTLLTLLSRRFEGDERQVAFSIQTLIGEAAFLGGPIFVAAAVALASPSAALALLVAFVAIGTAGFATSRAARDHTGTAPPPRSLGVLANPGMRVILASMILWGATFGGLDVALPAFADERGSAATGGVLLSILSAGVAIGSLVYGTRPSGRSLERRFVLVSAVGAVSFAPLALATTVWELALLVFVVGLSLSLITVCTWLLVAHVTSEAVRTEATTWIGSAIAVGIAIGATAVGALVESAGARTALVAAFVSSSLAFLLALARQGTMRGAVAA